MYLWAFSSENLNFVIYHRLSLSVGSANDLDTPIFLIIFLVGILLIFHGMNKEVNLTIVLGSLVLAVPTCVVIPSCLAFKYYRKLWREKRDEQRDKRKTYQYDNPFKSESELEL